MSTPDGNSLLVRSFAVLENLTRNARQLPVQEQGQERATQDQRRARSGRQNLPELNGLGHVRLLTWVFVPYAIGPLATHKGNFWRGGF